MTDTRSKLFPGLILFVCLGVIGLFTGGFLGSLFARGGMGWDQIADVLGSAMLGAVGGLAAGLALAVRLRIAVLRRVARIAGLVALLLIGAVLARGWWINERKAAERPEPVLTPTPEPTRPAE